MSLVEAVHGAIATVIFLSQQMGSTGYQRKCSHGAIATMTMMTINPIQPISCDKQIAVAIAPCEQPMICQ